MKRKILTAAFFSMSLVLTAGLTANAIEPGPETRQTAPAQALDEKPAAKEAASTASDTTESMKTDASPMVTPEAAQENIAEAIVAQPTSELQIPVANEEADQPRDYIVIKHDTLWDISAKLLKDPFKWPEIWKKNPQLKDPNLIHPGNILRIWPNGKVELVGQKESQPVATIDTTGTVEKQRPEDMPVVSLEPQEETVVVLEPQAENGKAGANGAAAAPLDQQAASLTAPAVQSFSAAALEHQGFVSEKSISESGAIAASRDGQNYMQSGDIVFISLKNSALNHDSFKIGDMFTIFQVGQKMVHPVTEKKLGHLIDILGSLEITGTDKVMAGKIIKSYKEIPVGARIRPYTETIKKIEITKAETTIDSVVVGSLESKDYMSAGDVIYIDKGVKSGIRQGNVLDIYKKSNKAMDPFEGKKFVLPPVKVGQLIVASVNDVTSACIVIQTSAGINPGDIVRSEPTKK